MPLYRARTIPLRRSYGKKKRRTNDKKGIIGEAYIPTHSKVVGKYKKLDFRQRTINALVQPVVFTDVETGVVDTNSAGKQGVKEVAMFGDSGDLDNVYTKWQDLKTDTTNSNNFLVTLGNVYSAGYNAVLRSVAMSTTFFNSCNATVEMEVLIYRARRGCPVASDLPTRVLSVLGAWAHAETANNFPRNVQDPFALTDSELTLNRRPYSTTCREVVNEHWRLVDKKNVVLTPGQSFKHYYKLNANKTLTGEFVKTYGITNLTHVMLVIVKGQLFNGSYVGPSDITTSTCEVSYMATKTYTFVPGLDRRRAMQCQISDAPSTVLLPQFMNPETRENVNYQEAN